MDNITDLIIANEGLIYSIIGKYKNYFELDDLYQAAVMGLLKAHKKYNRQSNAKFTTYAYPYILGEVIKYINNCRCIKLNRSIQILYPRIIRAKETLSQKMMKEPTSYELSLFLEVDEAVIEEVLTASSEVESLDRIMSEESGNIALYDQIGLPDNQIENYPLQHELDNLPPEEKELIMARYYDDMSQREVGNILGMYQVEVSRHEQRILKKLKDKMAA